MPRKQKKITGSDLWELIRSYDRPALMKSTAYGDGGVNLLWERLERAAMNQIDEGESILSRYAIWANTVCDNIEAGLNQMRSGNIDKSSEYLIRAANSMSAFSDIQSLFDKRKLPQDQ